MSLSLDGFPLWPLRKRGRTVREHAGWAGRHRTTRDPLLAAYTVGWMGGSCGVVVGPCGERGDEKIAPAHASLFVWLVGYFSTVLTSPGRQRSV